MRAQWALSSFLLNFNYKVHHWAKVKKIRRFPSAGADIFTIEYTDTRPLSLKYKRRLNQEGWQDRGGLRINNTWCDTTLFI